MVGNNGSRNGGLMSTNQEHLKPSDSGDRGIGFLILGPKECPDKVLGPILDILFMDRIERILTRSFASQSANSNQRRLLKMWRQLEHGQRLSVNVGLSYAKEGHV